MISAPRPPTRSPAAAALLPLLLLLLLLAAAAAPTTVAAAGPMELRHQPQYHIRPRANWINDPNGPFRDPVTGKVHLYMQYNPFGPLWGNMSWYHVSSDDYVSWRLEGVAMRNDASYDGWGAYSGSITQTPLGDMLLMYTCVTPVDHQQQCVAVPAAPSADRRFRSWSKLASNPVMSTLDVPGLQGVNMFRDPTNLWRDPDNSSQWLVAFVAQIGGTARVVVFATDDPTWRGGYRFSHTLYEDRFDFYRMLECPDFFPLQTGAGAPQYFLKVSTMESHQDYMVYGAYTRAASLEGDGAERTVYVESADATPHFVDFGPYYASKQHHDPITGKTVLWGWTYEEDTEASAVARGWSGVLNLPREVVYDAAALKLRTRPLSELQGLRDAARSTVVAAQPVGNAASPVLVEPAAGSRQMEIEVEFTIPPTAFVTTSRYTAAAAPSFGLLVRHNADRTLFTRVSVTVNPIAMETDDNLYGGYDFTDAGDYKRVAMPRDVATAQCAALCDADRRCLSWTVNVPEAVTDATCSLKRLAGTLSANATCTSGRANKVVLGVDKGSSGTTGWTTPHYGPSAVYSHLDGKVTLRVFVDDSIIEVFKDDGLESVSTRVYIPDAAQNGVSLFATNLAEDVTASATIHYLNTIWTGDYDEPPPDSDAAATAIPHGPAPAMAAVAGLLLLLAALA